MPDDALDQLCPHCRAAYKIGPAHFGRKVRCAKCGQEFRAASPTPAAVTPPVSEPPPFRFSADTASSPPVVGPIHVRASRVLRTARNTRAKNINIAILIGMVLACGLALLAVIGKSQTPQASHHTDSLMLIVGPIIFVAAGLLYLLPSFIAYSRDHSNILPIAVINIFFGWTLIGWVGSLAWALSSSTNNQRVYVKKVIVRGEDDDEEW